MTRKLIPEDVRAFILSNIPSVPYLEALLLLRSTPDIDWNAVQLARRLYQTEQAAKGILDALHRRGVALNAENAYRYQPSDATLRELIERLAACYSGNLVAITNLIHSASRAGSTHGCHGASHRKT